MLTAKELSQAIGKPATFQTHGLTVEVQILDARRVFDRTDYLVQPAKGTGQSWVSSSAVRIASITA